MTSGWDAGTGCRPPAGLVCLLDGLAEGIARFAGSAFHKEIVDVGGQRRAAENADKPAATSSSAGRCAPDLAKRQHK